MTLGKIIGNIYSTINHEFYNSRKMLIVEKIRPDGSSTGKYVIAVDLVDAGWGETVLILDEGNSARQMLSVTNGPIRTVVVGVIDQINVA